ncbi:MAG TPA: HAD hydrolase-like protein [Blastocatellia bacterium]|nr:HAD hydrolase-like protein [Blastocatellia bacterium]
MKYRLAIFDFDGTLADSFPFFIRVFNQLAEQHGFKGIDPELAPTFRHYTPRQMMEFVGMPAWKLPFVARSFISLMKQNAASISLFDQIDDTLAYLANSGVILAIVSSNSYDNISQILGAANTKLIRHFECGMSIFGKTARIQKVLKKTGIPAHEAICIGDQVTDLEASRKLNIAFGAVAWGYGTIESLREHSPEEEFESVSAIRRIA